MTNWWGFHLRINARSCDKELVTNKEALTAWVKELVEVIEMVPYGEPQVVHFGPEPHLQGYTVMQLIETSNIAAHFCDAAGDAYIDIFSCKKFDINKAIEHFGNFFTPVSYTYDFTVRQA